MTVVVNMFAGPGSGKSTLSHGLMFELKLRGIKVEFAHEWIKHPVWQGRTDMPQYYTWAKQQKLMDGLKEQVDVIVTDSPTLLSVVYDDSNVNMFKQLVVAKFFEQDNLNVFVDRTKDYWAAGRYQTEEEAKGLDTKIHDLLHGKHPVMYPKYLLHSHVDCSRESLETLVQRVLDML